MTNLLLASRNDRNTGDQKAFAVFQAYICSSLGHLSCLLIRIIMSVATSRYNCRYVPSYIQTKSALSRTLKRKAAQNCLSSIRRLKSLPRCPSGAIRPVSLFT